jgi:hypothetical protein
MLKARHCANWHVDSRHMAAIDQAEERQRPRSLGEVLSLGLWCNKREPEVAIRCPGDAVWVGWQPFHLWIHAITTRIGLKTCIHKLWNWGNRHRHRHLPTHPPMCLQHQTWAP